MKDIKCLIAAAVFACLFFPTDARSGGTADELTQAQKDSVKTILSKYKNETLTSDEAKEIHRLMREVGVTGGAGEDNLSLIGLAKIDGFFRAQFLCGEIE